MIRFHEGPGSSEIELLDDAFSNAECTKAHTVAVLHEKCDYLLSGTVTLAGTGHTPKNPTLPAIGIAPRGDLISNEAQQAHLVSQ